MPKLKSNKSALKRFKKTASGAIRHRSANRAHINTKMTTKRKRNLRGLGMVAKADVGSIKQQLPFL